MDRYWLLTNTCYGTWLPGSARGFVGRVWEHRELEPKDELRIAHNEPGTAYDENIVGLEGESRELMKGPAIHLDKAQAETVLAQFQETARIRGWELRAVAIMHNHFHVVVGVLGDPKPSKILGDLKSWTTRALTKRFGAPQSKTWWTERGSKRELPNEEAIICATRYVLYEQPNPLIIWSPEQDLRRSSPRKN